MKTLTFARQDAQSELTDFVRTRTEIECIIEDLRIAGMRAGGKHEELAAELAMVERHIVEKEDSLKALVPEWSTQKAQEVAERRKLDETNAKLGALLAKQGRTSKFRTKAERDAYLKQEIKSMETYRATQTAALENTKQEAAGIHQGLVEIDGKIAGVQRRLEEGRTLVRESSEQVSKLKDQQAELLERRKELWREDTKLDSLVSHAADEMRSAERSLAGMMDKVCPGS